MSRSVGDETGGAQAAVIWGTVQKARDAVVYRAEEKGRGQREDAPGMEHPVQGKQGEQEEQVAHASGVARQGGRGTRLQDRGHAVADVSQAEGGRAARCCPGRRSDGGLKSRGRLAQGKTKEQLRGPRGRKPTSWSIQRSTKTRDRTRASSKCPEGRWQTGTGQQYAEMWTKSGTAGLEHSTRRAREVWHSEDHHLRGTGRGGK